jgi:hypothetical protein
VGKILVGTRICDFDQAPGTVSDALTFARSIQIMLAPEDLRILR